MCSAAWFFSPVGQTVMNRLCTIPTGLGQWGLNRASRKCLSTKDSIMKLVKETKTEIMVP